LRWHWSQRLRRRRSGKRHLQTQQTSPCKAPRRFRIFPAFGRTRCSDLSPRIGPGPGAEFVTHAGRREQLQFAGRRLQQSDLAALGGRGRQEVRAKSRYPARLFRTRTTSVFSSRALCFWNFEIQMLQLPDRVIILYPHDQDFRQVRLNQLHPAKVNPTRPRGFRRSLRR